MNDRDLAALENHLRYAFRRRDLLEQALRHSSFVNEHPGNGLENNERLEFLGDSVVNTVVSHLLMGRFPNLNEGHLSKIRSGLVNEAKLALIARNLHLGAFLLLGRGEANTGGHEKASILADGFEALMAAVYLDGGFDTVFSVISDHFSDLLNTVDGTEDHQDYKSRIQEIAQATMKRQPEYRVIGESGPDHDKTFTAELVVGDICAQGTGKSKKAAEQAAARKVLDLLESRS